MLVFIFILLLVVVTSKSSNLDVITRINENLKGSCTYKMHSGKLFNNHAYSNNNDQDVHGRRLQTAPTKLDSGDYLMSISGPYIQLDLPKSVSLHYRGIKVTVVDPNSDYYHDQLSNNPGSYLPYQCGIAGSNDDGATWKVLSAFNVLEDAVFSPDHVGYTQD